MQLPRQLVLWPALGVLPAAVKEGTKLSLLALRVASSIVPCGSFGPGRDTQEPNGTKLQLFLLDARWERGTAPLNGAGSRKSKSSRRSALPPGLQAVPLELLDVELTVRFLVRFHTARTGALR